MGSTTKPTQGGSFMSTPSITAAQVVAFAVALLGAATIVFKLNLSDAEQAKLVAVITAVVISAWPIADSIIRHGRSNAVAAQHNLAAAHIAATPIDQGDAGA
jgi:type III secretory pathway component EscS